MSVHTKQGAQGRPSRTSSLSVTHCMSTYELSHLILTECSRKSQYIQWSRRKQSVPSMYKDGRDAVLILPADAGLHRVTPATCLVPPQRHGRPASTCPARCEPRATRPCGPGADHSEFGDGVRTPLLHPRHIFGHRGRALVRLGRRRSHDPGTVTIKDRLTGQRLHPHPADPPVDKQTR